MLCVLLVHSSEVSHVGQEDGHLDNLGNAGSGSFEDGARVGDAEGGLFLDCAGGQDVAGGVAGDLTRGED
jgi:hypothetical protein